MLFALYSTRYTDARKLVFILLSGVFLGVAIFTKMPILFMIPAIGYLVYPHFSRKNAKLIALWFVPIILIPLIWPLYSLSVGQLDLWLRDVLWQTQRQSAGFASIVSAFLDYDPILFIAGFAGVIYAFVRRDLYLLLWTIPFMGFLATIGYVQYFYWIPLLPVFCIASARLIEKLTAKNLRYYLVVISGITIFGLISTSLLITSNMTSAQFEAIAFAADFADNQTTIVSSPVYSWIFIYVFDIDHALVDYRELLFSPIMTEKMLLISDRHFQSNIGAGVQLQQAYNQTSNIAVFEGEVGRYDIDLYPYTSMRANYEGSLIEVREN
jgi:4-amino-4-deoxy-L-arabinose transferase-like glycosyltransferase